MKDITDLDHRLVAIGKRLERNLDDWEAWAAKADILCSLGLHETAIRYCDKSLTLNPANVLTLRTKYIALTNSESPKKQMKSLQKQFELGYKIDQPGSLV